MGAPLSGKGIEAGQIKWGEIVMGLSKEHYPATRVYHKGDIYLENGMRGPQMIGLSGHVASSGSRIHRACWYERDPIDEITPLLTADGVDPHQFRKQLAIAPSGFFDYLSDKFSARFIPFADYVSEESRTKALALQRVAGTPALTCVGSFGVL